MQPDGIRALIEKHDLEMVVVGSLATGNCVSHIGRRVLPDTDLLTSLFGDKESLQALDGSLEGQLMPRIWSQGDVSCIVCKPGADVVVGVFTARTLDATALYWWSKEIDREVASLWEAM